MNVMKKGFYHFSETHGPNVKVNPTDAIWTNSKHGGHCVLDINLATGSSVELRAGGTGQFAVGFIEASKLTDETTYERILQRCIGWGRYTFRNKTKRISIRRLSSLEVIFVMGKEEISHKFVRAFDEEDGFLPVLDMHWGVIDLTLQSGNVALSSTDDMVQDLPMQIFTKTENIKLSPDGRSIRLKDPYPWCLCMIQNPFHESEDLVLECKRSVNSKSAFIEVFMTNTTPADLSNNEVDKSLLSICKFSVRQYSRLRIQASQGPGGLQIIRYTFRSDFYYKNGYKSNIDTNLPVTMCFRLFQTNVDIADVSLHTSINAIFNSSCGGPCSPAIMTRREPALSPPPLDRPRRRRAAQSRQRKAKAENGDDTRAKPQTDQKFRFS